jgi:hypothetical protein
MPEILYQLHTADHAILLSSAELAALDLVVGATITERELRHRVMRLPTLSRIQAIHAMLDQEEAGAVLTVDYWSRT